ncbi:MAG: Na+/H+ antiporter NhaA [Bacteroidales bacterium]|nr:Na+/H+ antiporter NhaA [Bacteroidales bacterium]
MSTNNFKISHFIKEESLGGILLILSTITALIWANTSESYNHLWHDLILGFSFGDFSLHHSIGHWINDGLMAVFFFTIGLEIKREVMGGELSSMKKASLPIFAAIGGMLVPAIIYVLFNYNHPQYSSGWGIPMATDIAFALGLMALLGDRVNINLKIFLTALAIADDLGAIMVIAIFYTENININELINAGVFIAILIIANKLGVRRTAFYAIVGLFGVWTSFLFSGVHATIAGVLIALTIPARPKIDTPEFVSRIKTKISKFEKENTNDVSLLTSNQAHLVDAIDDLTDDAHTPLQKLEHSLHPITAYFILPLFALANAGIVIEGKLIDLLMTPISLGIIAGLVIGKTLGITAFSWIAIKLKLANLPEGTGWKEVIGASMLAGIGFTMSIFVADLAFNDQETIQTAKVGIFAASFIAAILGLILLSSSSKNKKLGE